jgi:hypothetical protein
MSILSDCCPPCPTVNVNTPGSPGTNGADGADGADGVNAFTLTTANFTLPAISGNIPVNVANSSWMVIGQNLFISDGTTQGNFEVVSLPTSSSVQLEFLGYPGDGTPGMAIVAGALVSPAGLEGVAAPTPANTPAIGSGSAYSLTATPALLNLGTVTPSIIIAATGNYLLAAWARYDYNAATFATNRVVTTKIRRTNNTPTDITGTTRAFLTPVSLLAWKATSGADEITTLTYTATGYVVALIQYAGTAGDTLELWGSVDVLPTAGSLDAVEASLIAFGPF